MRLLSSCLLAALLCTTVSASAQISGHVGGAPPEAGSAVAPAQIYNRILGSAEKEFVDLAEAMPEDKYSFAPSQGLFTGVRTFADQVKHVAEANYHYFGPLNGISHSQVPDIAKLTTKADILKALKDSFALGHKIADSTTAENAFTALPTGGTRAGTLSGAASHTMDHYGQLVIYLRMNGIVPPASRK